jgi:L,D-transpeptidase ErfK/SrfK
VIVRGLSMLAVFLIISAPANPANRLEEGSVGQEAGSYTSRVVGEVASVAGEAVERSLGRMLISEIVEYVVAEGETFDTIGARLGVDPKAIARRNTRWVRAQLPAGMKLLVEAHRTVPVGVEHGILINVPQKMLFVLGENGSVMAVPVAVGPSDWPTPNGAFRVTHKETNPTRDVPLSIQNEMERQGRPVVSPVLPRPQHPLGEYWIRLSVPNMAIHGMSTQPSVPGFTTYGCICVGSDHIKALFDLVTVGDPGEIIYEPTLLTRHEGRFFVEAHLDVYGVRTSAVLDLEAAAYRFGVRDRIDWRRVQDVVRRREGLAIDVTVK